MPRAEASIVINRPIEEVFEFLTDPANNLLWQGGASESERTSEGPAGVGQTGRLVLTFLGRRMESTWETTEYEANRVMAYKSTSGSVGYEGRWTLEPVEGGTRYTYVLDTESGLGGVFGRLADPLVGRLYQRQMQADLGNLKELLEAQAEKSA